MRNQQHGRDIRLQVNGSDRVLSFFSRFVIETVQPDKAVLILKDQRRQFK